MGDEVERGSQDFKAIFDAALEVDRGSFFEIFRRAGDLADLEVEHDGLGDHLVVEDEIVGVFEQGEGLQQFPREGAIPGVILRQLDAEEEILKSC